MKWRIDYYYSKYKGGIRRSSVCSLLDDIINIVLLEQYKQLSPNWGFGLCLWSFTHWPFSGQLYKCSCGKWPLGELLSGAICIYGYFVCCLLVEVGAATPKTLLNLPRCKRTAKGSIGLTTVEGFLSPQKSLWTNSQACFIQSEEKVNTFIKGLSKTWISHSNATKCTRYNYAKCIFLFFQHPICVAASSTYVKELFWIPNGSVSLFIETSLGWSGKRKTALTEHGASRDRFSVQPEGDLRQNDGHDAREVGLNHEIANFPFQMEICCHHNIFACSGRRETERETLGVRARRAGIFKGKKHSISTSNPLKTPLEVVAGHQNEWRVGRCWSEHTSHVWEHSKVIVTIDNLSIKKTTNSYIPFSGAASQWCCLQFYDPRQWKFPLSTSPFMPCP